MAVNQELKDLIKTIKIRNNINQSEIAKNLGVTNTYLSDVINGRAPANDRFMNKIRNLYEMPLPEIRTDLKTYGGLDQNDNTLPLIPIDAIAGFPRGDIDPVMLSQCERYAVPEFISKGADFLIRVSGDSMLPTYKSGDILACRKIHEFTFIQWGNVYVIDTQQGALVKRLFPSKIDQKVTCKSDNIELFPEFTIEKDEIRSLSIVIGLIRLE